MQHYCSTGKELVCTIYYTSKELGAHPHNLIHEQRITIVGPSNIILVNLTVPQKDARHSSSEGGGRTGPSRHGQEQ